VVQTRAGTAKPFALNYLLAFEPATLPIALDAGARRALDLGADYLICQGIEAGGHVQATQKLEEVLPSVIEEAKKIPVLAAGGIASGAHIRRALRLGAAGVLVGTRFVATKECNAHDEYKGALARAKAADTVLTVCFQDGWTNAPHRVLRNCTFAMWEAAGCPPPGKRPGEGDVLTTNAVTGAKKVRYSASNPGRDDRGDVLELPLYAGQGVTLFATSPRRASWSHAYGRSASAPHEGARIGQPLAGRCL